MKLVVRELFLQCGTKIEQLVMKQNLMIFFEIWLFTSFQSVSQ